VEEIASYASLISYSWLLNLCQISCTARWLVPRDQNILHLAVRTAWSI